jgi:hypothetical protein
VLFASFHDANLQRKDKRRKEAKKHNLKQVMATHLILPCFSNARLIFLSPTNGALAACSFVSMLQFMKIRLRRGKKNCMTKAYAGRCSLAGTLPFLGSASA